LESKVLIIAEAGVNHNGDLHIAKELIVAAAEAEADIIKFQTFNAAQLVIKNAQKADYQKQATDEKESQFSMLSRLQLTKEMHQELLVECKKQGIQFLSTAFDIPSVDMLNQLGQSFFKIPSGEITNLPYLRYIARQHKPIVLSSGMATLDEISDALIAIEEAGNPREQVTILHCTTEYPAPMQDVNLRAMLTIQKTFQVKIGYSDHTLGIEVPIAAVAMGATVIEKHMTLDRNLPGPDHQASLEPAEFKKMVLSIRHIEQALGDGVKAPKTSELKNINIVRKSLVSKIQIKSGELFSEDNLTTKRPGSGISPMQWDQVIGKKARRDFDADELIEL